MFFITVILICKAGKFNSIFLFLRSSKYFVIWSSISVVDGHSQHPFDHSFGGRKTNSFASIFSSFWLNKRFSICIISEGADLVNSAQIGISVEPLDQLQNQTPAANTCVSNVDSFVQFSTKMVENLYNYVSSFGLTQSQMVPNPSETFVPLSSLQTWYNNFKRKLEYDPNFWKK